MHRVICLIGSVLLLCGPSTVMASQEITAESLASGVLSTVVYGIMGVVMATLGFKVVDALTPGNLSHDIAEGKNLPLALLAAAMILGICIISAAAISG